MIQGFKRSLFDRPQRGNRPRRGFVERIYRFFTEDVWKLEGVHLPVTRRVLRRASRLAFLTLNGFSSDRCLVRASALTYVTVLSVVPLLALSFAVLKGLGFYERLRRELIDPQLDRFLPVDPATSPASGLREAIERLLGFVDNTKFGALGVVGLVIVLWAAIELLGTIEAAFNDIWGVHRSRSLVRKVTDYLAIVVVIPVLIVAAIGLTSAAQNNGFVLLLEQRLGLGALINLAVRFAPLLAGWAAFSFLYLAMPNTRTQVSSSLLGGLVAGTAWQIALWAYLEFQIGVANYNVIYSTFAAVPIFLVWVQISWSIVLFGAELAFAHQHEHDYRRVAMWRAATPARRSAVGLRVLARVVQAFRRGTQAPSAEQLERELSLPSQPIDDVLETLEGARLVARVGSGQDPQTWLPAREPAAIRVVDVLEALEGARDVPGTSEPSALERTADRLLEGIAGERRGSVYNLSLSELCERGEALSRETDAAGLSEPGIEAG